MEIQPDFALDAADLNVGSQSRVQLKLIEQKSTIEMDKTTRQIALTLQQTIGEEDETSLQSLTEARAYFKDDIGATEALLLAEISKAVGYQLPGFLLSTLA